MDYHDPHKPLHWRQMRRISGVNTLDVGMLAEVVHRWLGYCRNVVAQTAIMIPERPPAQVNQGSGQTRVESPDTITTAAVMENGALFSGLWSGVAQFGDEPNAIELFGSEGTIRYLSGTDAPGTGKILAAKGTDSALQEIPVPDSEARTWTVEADFIRAVREGQRDPEPSFFDGMKYMEFTDAAIRSAAEGRRIELPYERNL
jgi:predicted dehydrogenase